MSIEAMRKALNYIENTEGELGIKLSCGDALREALAAQPPAAPVETGRQVSCAVGGKPYADSHQCSSAETAIAALAKRFWSIHPKEIQDLGITREQFYEREMRSLFASLTTQPQQSAATVQVRPLEWDEGKGELAGQLVWSSGDPWVFWIVKNPNEKYIWCENFNIEGFCPCSPVRGSYDTLDEAKAAAQADYDERIRAAVILNEPQRSAGKESDVVAELRDRFADAKTKANESAKVALNSYGAGYDLGYHDALGELLEYLTAGVKK